MAITLTKIVPYSGLCKYCLNLVRSQKYAPLSDEQEGIARLSCSAIPEFVFSDPNGEFYIGDTEVDEYLTLFTLNTNISNCNKYLPAAYVTIDLVEYDGANVTITYSIKGIVGSPTIDFFFVSEGTSIGSASAVDADGQTLVIPLVLADGSYYLYAKLSTLESSIIYPFEIATV